MSSLRYCIWRELLTLPSNARNASELRRLSKERNMQRYKKSVCTEQFGVEESNGWDWYAEVDKWIRLQRSGTSSGPQGDLTDTDPGIEAVNTADTVKQAVNRDDPADQAVNMDDPANQAVNMADPANQAVNLANPIRGCPRCDCINNLRVHLVSNEFHILTSLEPVLSTATGALGTSTAPTQPRSIQGFAPSHLLSLHNCL